MAKLKGSIKSGQVTVKSRLESDEQINEREISLFSSKLIRGFMRPTVVNNKKIIYSGPANSKLRSYLKAGIDKNIFFLIVAQSIEAVKKVEHNNLYLRNLVLDIDLTYINEMTKELHFVYQPIVSPHTSTNFFAYVNDIVFEGVFNCSEDTLYVKNFIGFLKQMKKVDFQEFENYILKVYPKAYMQIPKQMGQSGHIADKIYHCNTNASGNPDEGTTLLDFGDTTLLAEEEGTTVLQEEDCGGTTVLQQDEPSYSYLVRIKNGEKITISKSVFKLGKDKNHTDYFVDGNSAVSRSHADIITKNGSYFIYDNNSTNKTYVNGKAIPVQKEVEIFNNDTIKLGNEEFTFKIDAE